jgi:hypothetical protein
MTETHELRRAWKNEVVVAYVEELVLSQNLPVGLRKNRKISEVMARNPAKFQNRIFKIEGYYYTKLLCHLED